MSFQLWNERYETGDTPWENGIHHPEMERLFLEYTSSGKTVLEIGCGIGTNARWLAKAGYKVTAVDVASHAISTASQKAKQENIDIHFKTLDFLKEWNHLSTYSIVFDCAVFHILQEPSLRKEFTKKVSEICEEGGCWINISSSTDEAESITYKTGVKAPPSLSILEIVEAVEPYFEIIEMKRCEFKIRRNTQEAAIFYAWGSMFRKRGESL